MDENNEEEVLNKNASNELIEEGSNSISLNENTNNSPKKNKKVNKKIIIILIIVLLVLALVGFFIYKNYFSKPAETITTKTKAKEVYSKYRMYLSIYYKSNNSQISQELLNEILDAFDKSFAIIESLEFNRIEDSYEFRHHIIDSFELLRKILEKKSKCNIRTDIFDKYIADIQEQSEKINNYIIGLK